MLFQRIDINVLDRFLPLGETILPTSSLGCSYPHPVRGPIAGAGKPRRVDETFHQPRTIMVAPCEVFYQPLQAQAVMPQFRARRECSDLPRGGWFSDFLLDKMRS